jgi:hypothetical protein
MWIRFPGWPFPQHRTIAAAGLIILLLALQACGGSNDNYKRYGGPNGGGINNNAKFSGKILFVKNRNLFVLDGKTNSVTPVNFRQRQYAACAFAGRQKHAGLRGA